MKTLQSIIATLSVLALSAVLVSCSESSTLSTDNNDATTKDSGQSTQEEGSTTGSEIYLGLPLTISAHGNSYTIKSIELSENKYGNTVVSCETSGFDTLPIKNAVIVIPVYCAVVEGGDTILFKTFSTEGDITEFIFDSKLSPDTIIFYPEDNRGNTSEISVP